MRDQSLILRHIWSSVINARAVLALAESSPHFTGRSSILVASLVLGMKPYAVTIGRPDGKFCCLKARWHVELLDAPGDQRFDFQRNAVELEISLSIASIS